MTDLIKSTDSALLAAEDAYNRFDEAVSRFLATRKSERTRLTYQRALRLYRAHATGLDLDPFKADALITYSEQANAQRRDRDGSLANDTIRLRIKAVQSLFSWLYTFGLSPLKPQLIAELLTMPEAKKLSPRDILTEDEADRLLAAAVDDRARCIIRVMLDAGLRLAEALALRCGDVYSASDSYFIHVASGKGDKSRDVPIEPVLFEELAAYAAGSLGYDLLTDRGRPLFDDLYPRAVQRLVDRTAKEAGIAKRITPHSLRHTLGNTLRTLGYPLELVGEILGHSSYDTTKLYTRPASMLKQVERPALPWGR